MAELSTADEIELADISGAEYTALREDAAPGLLRLSLNRLKTWLLGSSALYINMTGAVDGQALVFDDSTDTFVPGDVAASGGGSGSGLVFSGAQANLNATNTAVNNAIIPWSATAYDTDAWFDNALDGFVVPVGVTKVEVSATTTYTSDIGTDALYFTKNGVQWGGAGHDANFGVRSITDTIPVVPGDIIRVFCTGNVTLNGANALTHFNIKAVDGSLLSSPSRGTVILKTSLRKSANQSIANNADTVLTWDVEECDEANVHDNVTNNQRILVPVGAKRFRATLQVAWASNNIGSRAATIVRNSVTSYPDADRLASFFTSANSDTVKVLDTGWREVDGVNFIAGTTYLAAFCYQTSGGALNFNGDAGNQAKPHFTVEFDMGTTYGTTEGVAFPTTPIANQRYFRTDLGIEYYWNVTAAKWLSMQQFVFQLPQNRNAAPLTATAVPGSFANPQYGRHDIYVEEVLYEGNMSAAANWTAQVFWSGIASANLVTASGVVDIERITPNLTILKTDAGGYWQLTKNSGGNIYPSCYVYYRLIG